MGEVPVLAKWRTSALKRYRRLQRRQGRRYIHCSYFGARFRADLDELIGYEIAINRLEYRNLSRFLAECRRRRPDIFVDVGANVGAYTCAVGANRLANQLVAFEPEPITFRALQRNVFDNGLTAILHQTALGAESGTAHITVASEANRGAACISETGDTPISIETLDQMLPVSGQVIAIKIDVEKYEMNVLAGGEQFFRSNEGYAQIEAIDESRPKVIEQMQTYGWHPVDEHGLDVMFAKLIGARPRASIRVS
jgi:FkbM family methyltransferase